MLSNADPAFRAVFLPTGQLVVWCVGLFQMSFVSLRVSESLKGEFVCIGIKVLEECSRCFSIKHRELRNLADLGRRTAVRRPPVTFTGRRAARQSIVSGSTSAAPPQTSQQHWLSRQVAACVGNADVQQCCRERLVHLAAMNANERRSHPTRDRHGAFTRHTAPESTPPRSRGAQR